MSSKRILSKSEFNEVTRRSFLMFVIGSFRVIYPHTEFIPGDCIRLMAAFLEECLTGENPRRILNCPPRTLKSFMASVAFPAFVLGHNPSAEIIGVSYGQELAETLGRYTRTLMESQFYQDLFPGTRISSTKHAADGFMTTRGGSRRATSVSGALTGLGADVIVVDDPIKADEVRSEERRDKVNSWSSNSMTSRLNEKLRGIVLIVMQRLHPADFVAEILDRDPNGWKVLSLPAIAMKDECYPYRDFFGASSFERKSGEALHPKRDSLEALQKQRATMTEPDFQAQYQQAPTMREGCIVKREWLKFFTPEGAPRDYFKILQSWDTACKTGDKNDWSVCATVMVVDGNYYIIDVFRARLSYPDLKRKALELFNQYRPNTVVIEDAASGSALIDELKFEGMYCVQPYRPKAGSNKLARFHAHAIKFEEGRVFLPHQAPWLEDFMAEITGFPGTKHDDQVDSISQALENLEMAARITQPATGPVGSIYPPRVYETW